MNNIVKVEVFNADGSLAQSEEKKNYITEGYLKNIEAYARGLIYSGTSITGGTAGSIGASQFILLTNNSDAIDNTEGVFTDSLVGCSYTNSSAAGAPKGGNRNLAESYKSNEKMVIVIDFATDRANGTFQTVHLAPDVTDPMSVSNSNLNALTKASLQYNGITSSGAICVDSTYIYIGEGKDEIYRFNKTTYDYVDIITLSTPVLSSIYDIDTDGTHFYIATGTSGDTVYKYTLAGAQVSSLGVSNCVGITVIGSTLYVSRSTSLYSLDTALVGPSVLIGIYEYTTTRISNDGTDLLGISGSALIKIDKTDASTLEYFGDIPITAAGVAYKSASEVYTSNADISVVDYSTPWNVVSRSRLDSAVTKNSIQTMKVTYSFNFS